MEGQHGRRGEFLVWAVGTAVLLLAGPGAAHAQEAGVRAAIESGNKTFVAAVAKGDAATLGSIYTAEAEAFPPGADAVKGRAAIETLWKSVMDTGVAAAELVTTEVDSQGNLAYEVGTYVMKNKAGVVADRGKYCVVWKKVAGKWMLHRDIWNTSLATKP